MTNRLNHPKTIADECGLEVIDFELEVRPISNNPGLLTDLYQLRMMQGYYKTGKADDITVFERFYRINPYGSTYTIVAGVDRALDYLENLSFTADDIAYLKTLGGFQEDFLRYLQSFRFTGDVYAMPEGSVAFPGEPLFIVKARRIEAQLVETALSTFLNHESLIATKASRVRWAAKDDPVLEFGLRRAQGMDAGVFGARAAIIGGCDATSNVLAGKMFGAKVVGTMAHSWVMSFASELEAFERFIVLYPENAILIVDTYDTLTSGVPNAIKAFQLAKSRGIKLMRYGIRLDSGDLAYLSGEARRMLDSEGFTNAIISASNDLDEHLIQELKTQGAKITEWGVGTKLITGDGCSALGGVYKLAAEYDKAGNEIPKLKISENPEKVTNPGTKAVYRIYDKATGKIKVDLIALRQESLSEIETLTVADEAHPWKKMTLRAGSYEKREMLSLVMQGGRRLIPVANLAAIQAYTARELKTLWDESRRLVNPHPVKVDLSNVLCSLKKELINSLRGK